MGLITALVITALPMAGDYYTNTLVSGSPNTNMVGNQIELFLLQGPLKNYGASLVLLLSIVLLFFMAYYLIRPSERARSAMTVQDVATRDVRRRPHKRVPPWRNPWRRPYVLAGITWLYIAVVAAADPGRHPVLVQRRPVPEHMAGILDPVVLLHTKRRCSRIPACCCHSRTASSWRVATVIVATPLGVMLAMGLTRWRSRTSKAANAHVAGSLGDA